MQTVAHLKAVKISFQLMYNSPLKNKHVFRNHALNESNVKGDASILAMTVYPDFLTTSEKLLILRFCFPIFDQNFPFC